MNAYVTFRSMEGKERALQAYNISSLQKLCASYCCCLDFYFKKKKLLQKGYLSVQETTDPKIIIWENLAVKNLKNFLIGSQTFMIGFMILFVGFWGQVYF